MIFSIVLVRIQKPNDLTLEQLLSAIPLPISAVEIKEVGFIRRKHLKEAATFDISLVKSDFFRKDFSVDLNEARSNVYTVLTNAIGDIRDYNGGMISKMTENLTRVKKHLLNTSKSEMFYIENFFYSISPVIMQSITPPREIAELYSHCLSCLTERTKSKNIEYKVTSLGLFSCHTICCDDDKKELLSTHFEKQLQNDKIYLSGIISHGMSHCFCITVKDMHSTKSTENSQNLQIEILRSIQLASE